jgi:hypothetical protein
MSEEPDYAGSPEDAKLKKQAKEREDRVDDNLKRQVGKEVTHVICGEVTFLPNEAYTASFDPEIPLDAAVTIMVKDFNRLAVQKKVGRQVFKGYCVRIRVVRDDGKSGLQGAPYSKLDQFAYSIDHQGLLRAHTLYEGANEIRTVGEFAQLELDGKGGFNYEGQVKLQIASTGILNKVKLREDIELSDAVDEPSGDFGQWLTTNDDGQKPPV